MNSILTIYSSKGGVGKTTLALNIASILNFADQKVLLIDTDPQNSIAAMVGSQHFSGLSELFTHPIDEIIQEIQEGLYILPAGIAAMEETNDYIVWMLTHQNDIKEAIDSLQEYFDYIIIDTPPGFSPMAEVSLMCADTVLTVLEADATSYATLDLMEKTLIKIKSKYPNKMIHFVTNKVYADEISVNFETLYRYLFQSMYLFALPFDSNVKNAASNLQMLKDYNTLSPLYQSLIQMVKKLFPTNNALKEITL